MFPSWLRVLHKAILLFPPPQKKKNCNYIMPKVIYIFILKKRVLTVHWYHSILCDVSWMFKFNFFFFLTKKIDFFFSHFYFIKKKKDLVVKLKVLIKKGKSHIRCSILDGVADIVPSQSSLGRGLARINSLGSIHFLAA